MQEPLRSSSKKRKRSASYDSDSDQESREGMSGFERKDSHQSGRVSPSEQSKKLYLGGVPVTMNESELRAIISKRVKQFDLQILRHKEHGNSKGCAWIEVYNQRDFQDLLTKKLIIHEKELPLTEYITDVEQRKKRMNENHERQCFFGGLPLEATKEHVDAYFSKFGTVTNSYIIYQEQNRSRGFGFVEFLTSEMVQKVLNVKEHRVLDKEILVEKRTTKTALKHGKTKESRSTNQSSRSEHQRKAETSMKSQQSFSEEYSLDASSAQLHPSSSSKFKNDYKDHESTKEYKTKSQSKYSSGSQKLKEKASQDRHHTESRYAENARSSKGEDYNQDRYQKYRGNEDAEYDSQSNISSYDASMSSHRRSDIQSTKQKSSNKPQDSFEGQPVSESAHQKTKHYKEGVKKPEKLRSHHESDRISSLKQNSMSERIAESESHSVRTTPFQQKQSKKAATSQVAGSVEYSSILDDSWKISKEDQSMNCSSKLSDIPHGTKPKDSSLDLENLDPDEARRRYLEQELAALDAKKNQAQQKAKRPEHSKASATAQEYRPKDPRVTADLRSYSPAMRVPSPPPRQAFVQNERGVSPGQHHYMIPVQGPPNPAYDPYFTPYPTSSGPVSGSYLPPVAPSQYGPPSPYRQMSPPRMHSPPRAASPGPYHPSYGTMGSMLPHAPYPVAHAPDSRRVSHHAGDMARMSSPGRPDPYAHMQRPHSPGRAPTYYYPPAMPTHAPQYGYPPASPGYPGPYPGHSSHGHMSPRSREYLDYPQHYPPQMMSQGYDPYQPYPQYPGYDTPQMMPAHHAPQHGYYYPPQHPAVYGQGQYPSHHMAGYGVPAPGHMRQHSPGSPRQSGHPTMPPHPASQMPTKRKKPKGVDSDDEEDLFDFIFKSGK